eukprot:5961372-Pyramimonas_sp.AAC.1
MLSCPGVSSLAKNASHSEDTAAATMEKRAVRERMRKAARTPKATETYCCAASGNLRPRRTAVLYLVLAATMQLPEKVLRTIGCAIATKSY